MTAIDGGVVLDASAAVALLTSGGAIGTWVADSCKGQRLSAPSVLPYEVANVLRRLERSKVIDKSSARLALADLNDLAVHQWPFAPFSARIWELRDNLTSYDAAYVALAEHLEVPLVTIEGRLAQAPGPVCEMWVPSNSQI